MLIRKYKKTDCGQLTELFYQTVHTVNAKDYTTEQLNAWATGDVDLKEWDNSLSEHESFVCVKEERIIGFGDIDKTGYLDRLYVHKDYQRQGVASAICDELERAVSTRKITTHASITAKPFFEKRGYGVVREQQVIRNGIFLTNYVMEKTVKRNLWEDTVRIELGKESDIDDWMILVNKVKENFPGLETKEALNEHRDTVLNFMSNGAAICAKSKDKIVGTLLFLKSHNRLCFLAVDEAYRRQHVAEKMVSYMLTFMNPEKEVVVTTYREGVQEGVAARAFYKRLGFVEGELTEEFGSPVQKFVFHW